MYKKVLVPLDGSELAECVLPHVKSVISACGTADVVLMRVVQPATLPVGTLSDGGAVFTEIEAERIRKETDAYNLKKAREYLDDTARKAKTDGANFKTEAVMGKPADLIADYAEKGKMDVIIMATHGRSGAVKFIRGSVADRVLRSSCVPVLMVKAPGCII